LCRCSAAWEESRADDVAAGRVANVGVPPVSHPSHLPFEHQPPPAPSLRRPEQVEEAVRSQLIARTVGGRDVVGRAMRILSGAHAAGGRVNAHGNAMGFNLVGLHKPNPVDIYSLNPRGFNPMRLVSTL
jgi:hypothetical protein